MDQLNNTQIVLLVLLVSFVTSIATGIFTVTLMEQAPAGVTRNINRVVEKTVETVVPTETQVVVREVIDKSEEDIIETVEKYSPALVTVTVPALGNTERSGFFITNDGDVLTHFSGLSNGTKVKLTFAGSPEAVNAEVVSVSGEQDLALVRPEGAGGINAPAIIPVKRTESTIGQKGLLMGRTTGIGTNVEQGMITSIPEDGHLRVNINSSANNVGGPFFSLPGVLLGISINSTVGVIVPANTIADFLIAGGLSIEESDQTAAVEDAIDE